MRSAFGIDAPPTSISLMADLLARYQSLHRERTSSLCKIRHISLCNFVKITPRERKPRDKLESKSIALCFYPSMPIMN
jgi:hypothetical protein